MYMTSRTPTSLMNKTLSFTFRTGCSKEKTELPAAERKRMLFF